MLGASSENVAAAAEGINRLGAGKTAPIFNASNKMDRLDIYEAKPAKMTAYLQNYGWHFSKALCDWAVSKMKDRSGAKLTPYDKAKVDSLLAQYGIELKNNEGYDAVYVMNMARADYYGSSITDDAHLAKFVKDYLDDIDGTKTRAMDEFYAHCVGSGTPILWTEVM